MGSGKDKCVGGMGLELWVCVDVGGRRGSQGRCGEYIYGWSRRVCTSCGRGLADSIVVLGEVYCSQESYGEVNGRREIQRFGVTVV